MMFKQVTVHRIFFYLTILFLPSQLGLHLWPQWALVLGRRVDYLSLTIYLTDILIMMTILFWFVESGIWNSVLRMRVKEMRTFVVSIIPNTKFFIALILLVFLNIAVAQQKEVSVYMWLKVLEYALFGWYIIKTKPRVVSMVSVLSVAVLYSSVISIVQFIIQHSLGGLLWFLGERTFSLSTAGIARMNICSAGVTGCQLLLRPYGTFSHPNVLGGFLVAILLVISPHVFGTQASDARSMYVKTYYGIVFLFGVIALFLTMSRSAIVVGALMFFIMIIRLAKRAHHDRRYWLSIGAACTVLLVVTFGIVGIRGIGADDESIVVRGQLNSAAFQIIASSPFVGAGLGNFLVRLPEVLPSRSVYFLQPVHNIYLLLLAETGVAGFVLFFCLLWSVLNIARSEKREARSKTNRSFLNNSPIAYRLSLISLLLLGLVDHYPLSLQQGQLLLTILIAFNLLPHESSRDSS